MGNDWNRPLVGQKTSYIFFSKVRRGGSDYYNGFWGEKTTKNFPTTYGSVKRGGGGVVRVAELHHRGKARVRSTFLRCVQ